MELLGSRKAGRQEGSTKEEGGRSEEWQVRKGQAVELTLCDQPLKRLSPSGRYKFYEFWPWHTGAEAGEVDENELIPAVHAFMNTVHTNTDTHRYTQTHIHTSLYTQLLT